MPEIIDELTELVAIPSVAFTGHDLAQVRRSAEHVASLFEQYAGGSGGSFEVGDDGVLALFTTVGGGGKDLYLPT